MVEYVYWVIILLLLIPFIDRLKDFNKKEYLKGLNDDSLKKLRKK